MEASTNTARGMVCPYCLSRVPVLSRRPDVWLGEGGGACQRCADQIPRDCPMCGEHIGERLVPLRCASGAELWLCDHCYPRFTGARPMRCDRCGVPLEFWPLEAPAHDVWVDGRKTTICESCLNLDLSIDQCVECAQWVEEVFRCESCGDHVCVSCTGLHREAGC